MTSIQGSHRSIARFSRIGFGVLIGAILIPISTAYADPSAPEPDPVAKKSSRPHPLEPQTRYTVRRQIENIRPTEWLASYGRVEVRRVRR